MREQENIKTFILQRPTTNDSEVWKAYWKLQGQPWRTEPEIDEERQRYLTERRSITPDIEQGIYPFKDIKLSRADVEWLLTTHDSGGMRGPIVWGDKTQVKREGLDLRGAYLLEVDLSSLPLVRLCCGLTLMRYAGHTEAQQVKAAVHLERANLRKTQLQEANLTMASMQEANLTEAQLQGAKLPKAQLQGAILLEAQLQKANLAQAQLQKANLTGARLQEADLDKAQLQRTQLQEANLTKVSMQEANLTEAQLQKAGLARAQLRFSNFIFAHLQEANLTEAELQGTTLIEAQLQGAKLPKAGLQGANLQRAFFDTATRLDMITLGDNEYGYVSLADICWGGVNLAVVNWASVEMLGDEQGAQQQKMNNGKIKTKVRRVNEYRMAVRANRQLATVLRDQGLNEEADRFAYRAQKLQRIVLQRQRKFGRYLFLGFLDLLAGYGYRPGRSVFWYFIMIFGFALAYHFFGHLSLFPPDAFIYSLTSFHGRGFFPGLEHRTSLHDPLIMLAAIEAVVGLFIEISFIATFTQRFFGR